MDGSPKTARIQTSVSMSRVSAHSCVVKTARCASGTCVVEPTLWEGQSSTVQCCLAVSTANCSFQLPFISDLLDCNYMICTESHTFIHVSLRWFSGRGSGEVSREPQKRQFRKTSAFRFNLFEFGLTEALLLSLITTTTDAGGPPQPTLPCSLTPQGPTLAWRRRREWL